MSVKTKSYDRNRFKKTYPRFREPPKPGLMTEGHVALDAFLVNFNNEDRRAVEVRGFYNTVPSVTITPLGDINNVNVWVSSISISSVPHGHGKNLSIVIEASAAFTGQVQVQVLEA